MEGHRFDLHQLSDRQVLDRLLKLHLTSAEVMADLLCHLAEVERRRLHLREATRSLFAYAVEVLHCTEDQAWRRVTAAQTATQFPVIFDLVASGELTLTSVNTLRAVLTQENHAEVLAEAKHKTKAQLEVMVARLAPKPDAPTRLARVAERPRPTMEVTPAELSLSAASTGRDGASLALRLAPTATTAATETPPPTPSATPTVTSSMIAPGSTSEPARAPAPPTRPDPARLAPLSPQRWKLSLTIGAEAERALRTARDLTPGGDLARVVERAVIEYAEKLEARKLAKLKGRKRRPALEAVPTSTAHPASLDAAAPPTATEPAAALKSALPPAAAPTSGESTAARPAASPVGVAPISALARVPDADPPRAVNRSDTRPSGHRPHIPRAVVREVVERDGGRCGYVSPETGRRCSETANLEVHS